MVIGNKKKSQDTSKIENEDENNDNEKLLEKLKEPLEETKNVHECKNLDFGHKFD